MEYAGGWNVIPPVRAGKGIAGARVGGSNAGGPSDVVVVVDDVFELVGLYPARPCSSIQPFSQADQADRPSYLPPYTCLAISVGRPGDHVGDACLASPASPPASLPAITPDQTESPSPARKRPHSSLAHALPCQSEQASGRSPSMSDASLQAPVASRSAHSRTPLPGVRTAQSSQSAAHHYSRLEACLPARLPARLQTRRSKRQRQRQRQQSANRVGRTTRSRFPPSQARSPRHLPPARHERVKQPQPLLRPTTAKATQSQRAKTNQTHIPQHASVPFLHARARAPVHVCNQPTSPLPNPPPPRPPEGSSRPGLARTRRGFPRS